MKPFDILGNSTDKRILIRLKSGEMITGTLKAFDQHINILLEEAELNGGKDVLRLGKVLVRGDNIILVSPA